MLDWEWLLKFSLQYSDGTKKSEFKPMSPEDRAFLEAALRRALWYRACALPLFHRHCGAAYCQSRWHTAGGHAALQIQRGFHQRFKIGQTRSKGCDHAHHPVLWNSEWRVDGQSILSGYAARIWLQGRRFCDEQRLRHARDETKRTNTCRGVSAIPFEPKYAAVFVCWSAHTPEKSVAHH